MNYTIENDALSVSVTSLGGSLTSIYDKKAKEELLYQKETDSWQGQDIAIFPFIARLKGKVFTHKGKEYSLKNHGLCRYAEFSLLEKKEDSVSLLYESSEESLKDYPFPFRFVATYRLEGNAVRIIYEIANTGEETMPFGLGAQPAFIVDSKVVDGVLDTSDNEVRLDKPTRLTRIVFDEKGEFIRGEEDYGIKDSLPTGKEVFQTYKTLAVKGEGIDHVKLVRKSGRTLDFRFDNIEYLILWSFEETGSYVAVEPWMSLPDFEDGPKEITEKKTLIHLEKGQVYSFSYSIRI